MSSSVTIEPLIGSISLLFTAIKDLQMANQDLRNAEKTLRQMKDHCGNTVEVDAVVTGTAGEKIGLKQTADGKIEFVTADPQKAQKSVDKITQAYARLKILDEVKKKGYQKVKEETLADGSVRLVVERWR